MTAEQAREIASNPENNPVLAELLKVIREAAALGETRFSSYVSLIHGWESPRGRAYLRALDYLDHLGYTTSYSGRGNISISWEARS